MVVVIWLARRFFSSAMCTIPLCTAKDLHCDANTRTGRIALWHAGAPSLPWCAHSKQSYPSGIARLGRWLGCRPWRSSSSCCRGYNETPNEHTLEAAISKRPSPWLSFCSAQHCHGWCLVASCDSFWQHLCVGPAACFWATSQPMVSIRPFELHPDLAPLQLTKPVTNDEGREFWDNLVWRCRTIAPTA